MSTSRLPFSFRFTTKLSTAWSCPSAPPPVPAGRKADPPRSCIDPALSDSSFRQPGRITICKPGGRCSLYRWTNSSGPSSAAKVKSAYSASLNTPTGKGKLKSSGPAVKPWETRWVACPAARPFHRPQQIKMRDIDLFTFGELKTNHIIHSAPLTRSYVRNPDRLHSGCRHPSGNQAWWFPGPAPTPGAKVCIDTWAQV